MKFDPKSFAWFATLICVWLTITYALKTRRESQNIITALALFAMSWAILLPYYEPNTPQSELLASFNGFLLIYVGTMLRREGFAKTQSPNQEKVYGIDRSALWLLSLTVLPSFAYAFNYLFSGNFDLIPLSYIWGTILTIVGFFSIWDGLRCLYEGNKKSRKIVSVIATLILVPYAIFEVSYLINVLSKHGIGTATQSMGPEYLVGFGILKLLFTVGLLIALSFIPAGQPSSPVRSIWQRLKIVVEGWLGHPSNNTNIPMRKLSQKKRRK